MERTSSYADHREELVRRLNRIEGQVRGIRRMIEEDRYCLDVVQQISAMNAAAQEVALIVLEDHLRKCVAEAVEGEGREAAIREMIRVLRKTVRA